VTLLTSQKRIQGILKSYGVKLKTFRRVRLRPLPFSTAGGGRGTKQKAEKGGFDKGARRVAVRKAIMTVCKWSLAVRDYS